MFLFVEARMQNFKTIRLLKVGEIQLAREDLHTNKHTNIGTDEAQ